MGKIVVINEQLDRSGTVYEMLTERPANRQEKRG